MNTIDKLSTIAKLNNANKTDQNEEQSGEFSKILASSLEEVNELQQKGDKAVADIATGEVKDLHQAALAIGKAETSMKMMLEVRNKALNVYKELSRTQI